MALTDEMLMMRPQPRSLMLSMTWRVTLNTLLRFVLITAIQSCSVMRLNSASRVMPALFTSTSTGARAAREVVLSAGTVNSPQLLMLSGIGPAGHLREHGIPVVQDLPGVGENLQDHLMVPVICRCPEPVTMSNAETFANLLRWLILGRGPYTSSGAEACAFVRSRPDLPAPDLELILVTCIYRNHYLQPPPQDEHGLSIVVLLLQPKRAGRI